MVVGFDTIVWVGIVGSMVDVVDWIVGFGYMVVVVVCSDNVGSVVGSLDPPPHEKLGWFFYPGFYVLENGLFLCLCWYPCTAFTCSSFLLRMDMAELHSFSPCLYSPQIPQLLVVRSP